MEVASLVSAVRVRLGEESLSPEELVARVEKSPARAARTVREHGAAIEASPATLSALRHSELGGYLDDEGGVDERAVATMGADVALFVIVALAVGAVGYGISYKAAYDAGKEAAETEAGGEGGPVGEGGEGEGEGDGDGGEGGTGDTGTAG